VSGKGNSWIVFLAIVALEGGVAVVARDLLPCCAVNVKDVAEFVRTPIDDAEALVLAGTDAAAFGTVAIGFFILGGLMISEARLEAFLPEELSVLPDVAVTTDLRRVSSSCCCRRT